MVYNYFFSQNTSHLLRLHTLSAYEACIMYILLFSTPPKTGRPYQINEINTCVLLLIVMSRLLLKEKRLREKYERAPCYKLKLKPEQTSSATMMIHTSYDIEGGGAYKLLLPFQIVVRLTFLTQSLATRLIQKICANIAKLK